MKAKAMKARKKGKASIARAIAFGAAHNADGTVTVFPPKEKKLIPGPGARARRPKRRKSA